MGGKKQRRGRKFEADEKQEQKGQGNRSQIEDATGGGCLELEEMIATDVAKGKAALGNGIIIILKGANIVHCSIISFSHFVFRIFAQCPHPFWTHLFMVSSTLSATQITQTGAVWDVVLFVDAHSGVEAMYCHSGHQMPQLLVLLLPRVCYHGLRSIEVLPDFFLFHLPVPQYRLHLREIFAVQKDVL